MRGETTMPAAIPISGYPSKTAAVVALREEGLKPAAIAARLGLKARQVHSLEYGNRRAVVNIPRDILELLRAPAARRGMSVSGLAIAIIATAALDGVIDAILDDAGGETL